ncbi:MarR family transcriptional regulator [Microbacterium gorillae]|uniref:MarR family transcriptional regulator n=1 Tax=Microbacterium gorillae TaxID=1231063 RepID=UPI000694B549|nr:MarR family transcriptional regulator [Microbacterium gorillae]
MPRNKDIATRPPLSSEDRASLVAPDGFEASVESLVVWANSASLRQKLMAAIEFPLPDDLLAFLLLNQLVYRGAGRATDMAEAIQTSTSNVTKVVRRLEDAGLVTRGPNPEDDRAIVIALTEQGRLAGHKIITQMDALYGASFADWDAADRADFQRLAIKFARSLDTASERAVSSVSGVPLAGS